MSRTQVEIKAEIDASIARSDQVVHTLSETLAQLKAVLERIRDEEDHGA